MSEARQKYDLQLSRIPPQNCADLEAYVAEVLAQPKAAPPAESNTNTEGDNSVELSQHERELLAVAKEAEKKKTQGEATTARILSKKSDQLSAEDRQELRDGIREYLSSTQI